MADSYHLFDPVTGVDLSLASTLLENFQPFLRAAETGPADAELISTLISLRGFLSGFSLWMHCKALPAISLGVNNAVRTSYIWDTLTCTFQYFYPNTEFAPSQSSLWSSDTTWENCHHSILASQRALGQLHCLFLTIMRRNSGKLLSCRIYLAKLSRY